jgi:hypothetical protein
MTYFQELNKKSVNRSERVHERCCVVLRYEHFRKGEVVFFANEKPDKFFVIFSGAVNILIPKTEANLKKDINEVRNPRKFAFSQRPPRSSITSASSLPPIPISHSLLEKFISVSAAQLTSSPTNFASEGGDSMLEPGISVARFRNELGRFQELLGGLPLERVELNSVDRLFEQGVYF